MGRVTRDDFDVRREDGYSVMRVSKGPEDRVGVAVHSNSVELLLDDLRDVAAWAWNSAVEGAAVSD